MYDEIVSDEMSTMNQFVVNEREKKLGIFALDKDIFNGQIGEEKQIRDDYVGREILEMIQNADDAALKGNIKNGRIKIELMGDELSFYNDGEEFDEGGVRSLLVPYNSSKPNDGITIGNKGLGFRALLSKAEKIRIESGGLSVRFGREDNELYYKSYNKHNLPKKPPIMNTPRIVKPYGTNGYTTVVRVKLKNEQAIEHIKELLQEVDEKTILFLQGNRGILVNDNGEKRLYEKEIYGNKCIIKTTANDIVVARNEYELVQKNYKMMIENAEGAFEEKEAKIVLAWTDAEREDYRTMYSYLKTNIQFPTNWLVHANFDLITNRSQIVSNEFNWSLMTGIVDLMFDYALNKTKTMQTSQWNACDYVMGNYDKFDDDIKYNGQSISDYFHTKLLNAKILPTVNDEYICLNDEPIHYESRLSDFLKGNEVSKLLKYADKSKYNTFVKDYVETYGYGELREIINAAISKMTMSDVVAFSIVYQGEFDWKKEYLQGMGYIPNFLRGKKNEFIPSIFVKFTEPTREVFRDLPEFLEFDFVQSAMLKEIMVQLRINNAEDFMKSSYAAFYGVRQYRLENVVREYYRSLSRRKRSVEEWIDFVRWCFKNKMDESRLSDEYDILIPTRNGELIDIEESYLTSDYGYDLVERIWPDEEGLICNYERFKLGENEKNDFVRFLCKLGAMKKPRKNIVDDSIDGLRKILETVDFDTVKELLLDDELDLWSSTAAKSDIYNAAWIKTSGIKYAPKHIILDKEYKQDYDRIFGISREKMDTLLGEKLASTLMAKTRIKTKITDFKIDIIYGVLLKLPEKDSKGDFAKRIVREMSEMDSGMVEDSIGFGDSENYRLFLEEGKIICRDGLYHSIDEAYYLADGTLSSAMTEGKVLITVPKKKGAEKIKKIFGVKKLTIDYIVHEFSKAIVDKKWQKEWNDLKVGIAATLKDTVDKMKAMKVVLCDDISICIKDKSGDDEAKDVIKELFDYDFAVGEEGAYYIAMPDEDWDEARFDPGFINSLADAIVMRIGTESAEESRDSIKAVLLSRNIRKEFAWDEDKLPIWDKVVGEMFGGKKLNNEDIAERNYKKVTDEIMMMDGQYRMSLYEYLSDAPIEKQKQYSVLVQEFKNWLPDRDDDTFKKDDFSAKKYVIDKMFGGMNVSVKNNCGNRYFKQFYNGLNKREQLLVMNDSELKDLIRFGRTEEVRKLLDKRISDEETPQIIETPIGEVVEEVQLTPESEISHKRLVKKTRRHTGGGFGGGSFYGGRRNSEEQKHENGKKGVRLTREYLERLGFEVRDMTGDSLADGENIDGDDSLGYDLEFMDNDVKHFVEVKSSEKKSEVSFTITNNEFETAERMNDIEGALYEVICVVDINGKDPKYVRFEWEELKPELMVNDYKYLKTITK